MIQNIIVMPTGFGSKATGPINLSKRWSFVVHHPLQCMSD